MVLKIAQERGNLPLIYALVIHYRGGHGHRWNAVYSIVLASSHRFYSIKLLVGMAKARMLRRTIGS